jgi:hypothetical protein
MFPTIVEVFPLPALIALRRPPQHMFKMAQLQQLCGATRSRIRIEQAKVAQQMQSHGDSSESANY